jgi:hypothetical protein
MTAILLSLTAVEAGVAAEPPPGLTDYGRVVWNLDGLLYATFGDRQVFEDYLDSKRDVPTFSTRFVSQAASIPYVYTFAAARGSTFTVERPSRPLRITTSALGSDTPLMIGAGYISCGGGEWLYQSDGYPSFNGAFWCARSG